LELVSVLSIGLARRLARGRKDQLEWQALDTKVHLLILLYNLKLEKGSLRAGLAFLDVDGYVKSMQAIWRRIQDFNLKLTE
jgi:hypothetical protein